MGHRRNASLEPLGRIEDYDELLPVLEYHPPLSSTPPAHDDIRESLQRIESRQRRQWSITVAFLLILLLTSFFAYGNHDRSCAPIPATSGSATGMSGMVGFIK